ncbi:MAG: arginase family protein [Methylobacterium sp.]|nr:arginase family protein [Methylobacterium sp.]
MMAAEMPDPARKPTLAQIASLLGAPIAELEAVRPGDICLVGLFEDHADGLHFGARFAARQIRYASQAERATPSAGIAPGILDLGDFNVFPLERERNRAALIRQIAALVERGAVPVIVGGAFAMGPILQQVLCRKEPGDVRHIRLPAANEPTMPSDGTHRMAVTIDMAAWQQGAPAGERPLAKLRCAIEGLPPQRIGAAHLTGLAPELDLCGRHESSLGRLVLEFLVAHLRKARA